MHKLNINQEKQTTQKNTTKQNYPGSVASYSKIQTRKPCCHKETARCRKCSFASKFANINNIHYKYKTSQASKAATHQSSKHADA